MPANSISTKFICTASFVFKPDAGVLYFSSVTSLKSRIQVKSTMLDSGVSVLCSSKTHLSLQHRKTRSKKGTCISFDILKIVCASLGTRFNKECFIFAKKMRTCRSSK